jgi:hypothetical protein
LARGFGRERGGFAQEAQWGFGRGLGGLFFHDRGED